MRIGNFKIVLRIVGLGIAVSNLVYSAPAFAKSKSIVKKKNLVCSERHLQLKTCTLSRPGLQVQVTEAKISLFDGTWRQLEDFPYTGEEYEWHDVRLKKIGSRDFLEVKIWDKPVGEAQIQSLIWFGYELKDLRLKPKWKEILQKRTLIKSTENTQSLERPKGQFNIPTKPKYLYDKTEKYSIGLNKAGVLVWEVGGRKHSENDGPPAAFKVMPPQSAEKTEGSKQESKPNPTATKPDTE